MRQLSGVALALLVALSSTAATARERITPQLYADALAPGVWRVVHETPWAANSVVVLMPDGTAVLADTPYTPAATRAVVSWIRTRLGAKRIVATNSHFHLDAAGGNSALVRAGIPVYGSTATAELIRTRGRANLAAVRRNLDKRPKDRAAFDGLVPTPPSKTFDPAKGLTLTFGGEAVQLIHPGAAHSPDSVVVWFPKRSLLFGGCMIRRGKNLGFVGDGDVPSWAHAMKALARFRSARIVVPGHGEPGDGALLDHTASLVQRHLQAHPR